MMAPSNEPLPTLSKPEAVGFSSERLAKLDAAMQGEIGEGKYAGLITMVARHGKIAHVGAYGYRDFEKKEPLRRDTIFRIASMTKPITGAAMMILYEEGKWQLDDPVAKFLPEFADMKVMADDGTLVDPIHPMTMRELVTSTAGIGSSGEAFANAAPGVVKAQKQWAAADIWGETLQDMIAGMAKLPLVSQPGTLFTYGYSHDVQSAIVERLSGQSFDIFLRKRLFEPLGMTDSGFGFPAAKRDRVAIAYDYDAAGRFVPPAYPPRFETIVGENVTYFSGGGGLYSTIDDYMRFAQMLANRGVLDNVRILAPPTVALMTSDLLPPGVLMQFGHDIVEQGYGVDVAVVHDPGRANFNGGPVGKGMYYWTGAFGTWFWVDPVYDIVVIGMMQQWLAAAVYLGVEHPAPDTRAKHRSMVYGALVEPGR